MLFALTKAVIDFVKQGDYRTVNKAVQMRDKSFLDHFVSTNEHSFLASPRHTKNIPIFLVKLKHSFNIC